MSQNKTFNIELNVVEHKCLETEASRDEWLWHYKLVHLNFNDIWNLKRRNMVLGLLEIDITNKVSEECVSENQYNNSFNKDAWRKSKGILKSYILMCVILSKWIQLEVTDTLSH